MSPRSSRSATCRYISDMRRPRYQAVVAGERCGDFGAERRPPEGHRHSERLKSDSAASERRALRPSSLPSSPAAGWTNIAFEETTAFDRAIGRAVQRDTTGQAQVLNPGLSAEVAEHVKLGRLQSRLQRRCNVLIAGSTAARLARRTETRRRARRGCRDGSPYRAQSGCWQKSECVSSVVSKVARSAIW